MHIGLIGGIGPAATISYYRRLVDAFANAGQPLQLTIAHAQITQLSANARQNNKQAQAEIFTSHLSELAGAGCDVAMITALTGHFCFDEVNALSPLHLINGVEIIDAFCKQERIEVLGLLGSTPVLSTNLFGMLRATKTVVPQTNLEGLGQDYMETALSGTCSDAARGRFFEAGASMVKDQGAQAILLAGTDLGLAFDGYDPGYRVIDALELHVQALLNLQLNT